MSGDVREAVATLRDSLHVLSEYPKIADDAAHEAWLNGNVAVDVLAEHAERAEGATMKMEEVNRLTRRALAAEALVVELQEALRDLEPLLDALAAMGWLKGEAALGIVRAALVAVTERPQEVSER